METNQAAPKIELPVTDTERRYVYRVPSATRPGRSYEVDVTANGGAAWCPCKDFATRRQPKIDAGFEPWTRLTTCRHTRRAGRHHLMKDLKRLAQQEENNP
jgi:hypothetical protein